MNPTMFYRLSKQTKHCSSNLGTVLQCLTECLTEIKLCKTLPSIIQHHPTLQNMFYETVLDDVLQCCFTHLDRPELTCTPPLLKLHQLKGPIWFHVIPQFMLCESRELLLLQDTSPHLPPPPLLWTHQNLFPQFV